MKDNIAIFWYRRDLRIEDNVGLYHALKNDKNVLPIFIFDTDSIDELPKNDARISFIYQLLTEIDATFKKHKSGLVIKKGKPIAVFKELTKAYTLSAVYTNNDYEPYALKRDKEIHAFLKEQGIAFNSFKDQVIFEQDEVVKDDGKPYTVYTPYSKKWLKHCTSESYKAVPTASVLDKLYTHNNPLLSLSDIGFTQSDISVKPFDISKTLMKNYEDTRNFPDQEGTSYLSPHLRFGSISIRKCVAEAFQIENKTFLKELIWREFFMQILYHFPDSATQNFKQKYDAIQWRNNETDFKNWCEGKTGYWFVDAGMRQLNATGYMHNRVRMITAGFLCKHLLIDWRWGEAYFASKLLDYDMAQNVGNWQWAAGTGCDAAPYFRIFNPITQIKSFDKNLNYIKKWVPEYQELTYPKPIIDHKEARERCLETYKKALN